MICLVVRLTVKAGEDKRVADLFRPLQAASRQEPGCVFYVIHQHKDDPRKFLAYEQYRDEAALDAHRNSGHYKKYLIEGINEFVEHREADLYRPL
jgi:quinol monooxygenase YgiN